MSNKKGYVYKSYKTRLELNNFQNTRFFQFAGAARFIYNWTLEIQQKNYEQGNSFLTAYSVQKLLTSLKKEEGKEWLNEVSNTVLQKSVEDACNAYISFFKKLTSFPRFKSKRNSKPSFYCKIESSGITASTVKLEKISLSRRTNKKLKNVIKLSRKNYIPTNAVYKNPRITFDGLHWYFSVTVEQEKDFKKPENEGIGIDVGIKELASCSDGVSYENISKSLKVRNIIKRRKYLQRKVSRQYEANREDNKYTKTKNISKTEKRIKKLYKRESNTKTDFFRKSVSEIVNREPKFITLETLNIKGMMKNRHLAKAIGEASLYTFQSMIERKCLEKGILVFKAGRFFPSTKMCSNCGALQEMPLNKRTYSCECGLELDRDFNASLNLKNYGASKLLEVS